MPNAKRVDGLNFAGFVAQTVGATLLGCGFSFAASVLVARALGPAGKGIVAVVLLYPMLLFTLGHLSLNKVLISHVGLSRYSLRDFCGTLGIFLCAMCLVLFAGFWGCYRFFPSVFTRAASPFVIGLGLSIVPFFFIHQLYAGILQTQQEMSKFNTVAVSQPFFTFVILLLFFAAGGLTVSRVVMSFAMANAVSSGLALWFVARLFPGGWSWRPALLRDLVRDGLKLHAGVIAVLVFLKIDQLMLSQYRGAASVGFYTVSVSYSELLILVPAAVQNVFYAKITRMLSEKIDLVPKTLLVYRHNFYLLLLFSAILVIGIYPLTRFFYGRTFLPSVFLFLILLPGAFFLYLNTSFANYLVGLRKFGAVSAISIGAACLNVGLNVIFIPRWDASGAAFSSSLTYFLVGLAYIVVFLRVSHLTPKDLGRNLRLTREDLSLYREFSRSLFSKK